MVLCNLTCGQSIPSRYAGNGERIAAGVGTCPSPAGAGDSSNKRMFEVSAAGAGTCPSPGGAGADIEDECMKAHLFVRLGHWVHAAEFELTDPSLNPRLTRSE